MEPASPEARAISSRCGHSTSTGARPRNNGPGKSPFRPTPDWPTASLAAISAKRSAKVVEENGLTSTKSMVPADRVKHLAQGEGAGCRDVDVDLLIVGGLADRQFLQRHPLLIDALGIARVAAANNLVDEAPPCRKIVEVARGTQQQGIFQRSFEMAMRAFDRAVLVRHARIVAGRRHAVMAAQRLVARRQILLGVGAEIAERGREAVASVLLGDPAQRPQGVLQPFRKGYKTFAAEHDVGVFEAGEG